MNMSQADLEIPPWVRCGRSTGTGQMMVEVLPNCPHLHMIRGRMVTSKKDCRRCEHGRIDGGTKG